MTLTPDEARGMLADIDQIAKRMRNTLAASALAPNLMIWGLVWGVGFVCAYHWPEKANLGWIPFVGVGLLLSMIVGMRQHRQRLVLSDGERKMGWQLMWFWLTIFSYATAMALILHPTDGRDFVAIFVMFSMMAYVIMGLWLRSAVLIFVGVLVSAATLAGRFMFDPQHFLLWMAAFGGGGLFFPGVYVYWRWR